jgi:KUP system potassium uptake protein
MGNVSRAEVPGNALLARPYPARFISSLCRHPAFRQLSEQMKNEAKPHRARALLALGALGVVYGDIGTSPLYALRECFAGPLGLPAVPANVLGLLSLIIWSLTLIVAVKYLTVILRVTNAGEGGILALMSLAAPEDGKGIGRGRAVLAALGVFGAALLYGDGMITPAISVLSAMEGLHLATPLFAPYVVPLTVAAIVALFAVQHRGAGQVGAVFGPVMLVWFGALAALGVAGLLRAPEVLGAFNPLHAVRFLAGHGADGFLVLGAVFLVVTGAEALYADVGHFGAAPIRLAWFAVAFPALVLNYLGQGALLLRDPAAVRNPFYLLAPGWVLLPLVVLSAAATIIASQALISGAFSLTMQAAQLGYLPRLKILHTSSSERGQIYLPGVNWLLMTACIGLVLGFRTSSNLAAAYGIAVVLTMLITTLLFYFAARRLWQWPAWQAGGLCVLFATAELAFFSANLAKIVHGGWFPLTVAALLFAVMMTWKAGRTRLRATVQSSLKPLEVFLADLQRQAPQRVAGTAIFLTGGLEGAPLALLHNLKHNHVLHERNVLLTVVTEPSPRVEASRRVGIEALGDGFWRVIGRYGFMEQPDIPRLLPRVPLDGAAIDPATATFFLSRESIRPARRGWRMRLFALMTRNAPPATDYFHLPPGRMVELGMQVEL